MRVCSCFLFSHEQTEMDNFHFIISPGYILFISNMVFQDISDSNALFILFLFDNVSELLIKSIIGSIHPGDIWVILPTILLLLLYLGFYKNNTGAYEPLPKRIAYGAMIFIICSFGYLATPLKAAIIKDPNRPSPWIRWTASSGPSFYVEANGLVPYFVYTLTKATTTSKKITPEEKNYIDRFILSKEKNKYTIRFLIIPEKI